jgi:D-serine deaminase-like pyridoxal phosphate-dependent protein
MVELPYNQLKEIFKDIPRPFAFIDLDILNENILLTSSRSGNKKIRIATKSIRSLEVLHYLKEKLSLQFTGLMTFHLEEALFLLNNGFDHCLMGYPQKVSIKQAELIKDLASKNKSLVLMIDSIDHLVYLEKIGKDRDVVFEVCVDIDLSLRLPKLNFGVYRSPLNQLKQFRVIFDFIKNSTNLKCVGIMGYEAQVAGLQDLNHKGKVYDLMIQGLKRVSLIKINKLRKEVVSLAENYFNLEFVNGGGSGSISQSSQDKSLTEVAIGSGYYCPHLFDEYNEKFKPSCGFAIEVERRPREDYITCHGGGYIASGALDINKMPKVFSPKGLICEPNEMFGEVQTPFKNKGEIKLEIGDPVFLRHAKSGELLERFNEIHILEKNKITKKWKSYRGEGLCFL